MELYTLLTANGKFNNIEIMSHAHFLKAYRRISLGDALKKAWYYAKEQQKEYNEAKEAIANNDYHFPKKQGNVLKSFFLSGHSDNVNYDNYWR